MDKYLMDLVKANTPKLNPDVVNGYATVQLKEAPNYIDTIFAWAFKSLESICDLHYKGYEICTPREEFEYIARPRTSTTSFKRSSNRTINIGESSIFLVKYYFIYKGEKLDPLYLYIPFCDEAGMIMIGGTRRFLYPVLSNKIVSSTKEGVFIKILKDKKNFYREYHKVFINGKLANIGVIWSSLYDATNRRNKMEDTTPCLSTNIHYIIAKYGFDEFWRRYYGWIPETFSINDYKNNKMDIDHDKYVYLMSTQIKPKLIKEFEYFPTDIGFKVPKNLWSTDVQSTLVTITYILDYFPDKITKEYIHGTYIWKLTLGYVNFSSIYKDQEIFSKTDEHFASLEDSVHELYKHKLENIGYKCENIYDLLFYIKRDFAKSHTKGDSIRTMYGKELDILDSTLSKLVSSIFRASYDIKKKINSKKDLTKSEVQDLIRKSIGFGYVFRLFNNSGGNKSNAFDVSYSGDNKFFKITSTIIPQEGKKGKHSGGSGSENDPNIKLHSSYAECGAYLAIAKREPIGNGGINPAVLVDQYGSLMGREEFKEMLEEAQKMIDS
jgi:hypothetical protein